MGRPEKNTVEYFPHFIGGGKKMFFIEHKYGNDGYATWFKILETLAESEYHYLNLNGSSEVMFLAAKCRISEPLLLGIINDLVTMEIFNKKLWESKILYSEKFIESIQDVYNRRNNKCIHLDSLCAHLLSKGILKSSLSVPQGNNNTQTKLNKTKEDKNKVFTPPKIDDVINYFSENGYSKEAAKKAFQYYDSANWRDSKGNQVKSWKQKMISVWFKDENKIITNQPIRRHQGASN